MIHELRRKTRVNEANLAARTCALNRAAWAVTDVLCNARRSHAPLRALGVHGDVRGGLEAAALTFWTGVVCRFQTWLTTSEANGTIYTQLIALQSRRR